MFLTGFPISQDSTLQTVLCSSMGPLLLVWQLVSHYPTLCFIVLSNCHLHRQSCCLPWPLPCTALLLPRNLYSLRDLAVACTGIRPILFLFFTEHAFRIQTNIQS